MQDRSYTPFGEEYLRRFDIDNPLISHSVSDLWGSDAGIEAYGQVGQARYVVAVQNGGGTTSQTLQGDKQVAGRLSYDFGKTLHVSVSGMRTGHLSVQNGVSSEWFSGGFFRSIGTANTTSFYADLVEGDVSLNLPIVQINAAGGYIRYGDDAIPPGPESPGCFTIITSREHTISTDISFARRVSAKSWRITVFQSSAAA